MSGALFYGLGECLPCESIFPIFSLQEPGTSVSDVYVKVHYLSIDEKSGSVGEEGEKVFFGVGGERFFEQSVTGEACLLKVKAGALIKEEEREIPVEVSVTERLGKKQFLHQFREHVRSAGDLARLLEEMEVPGGLLQEYLDLGESIDAYLPSIFMESLGLGESLWGMAAVAILEKASEETREAIFGPGTLLRGDFWFDASNLTTGFYLAVVFNPDARWGEMDGQLEFESDDWSVDESGRLIPPKSFKKSGGKVPNYMIFEIC